MAEKVKKISKTMVALIIILSIILVSFVGIAVAYFVESKTYTGTIDFGEIKLDVSATSLDGNNLKYSKSGISTDTIWTGKFNSSGKIKMSFSVELNSGSEPAYFLVALTDNNNLFKNGFYYFDATTNETAESTITNHKVGKIETGDKHEFTFTTEMPKNKEIDLETKANIKLNIYAVKQADFNEYNETNHNKSAYNVLTNKYYTIKDNYIYFGSFPQTFAGTDATVLGITSTTTDENGYFTATDGTKYAKITANPYETSYTYNDGTKILKTEAYFKVEPLKWRILKENSDGTALIVCDNVVNAMAYQTAGTSSNYKESDLRAYLTNEFYTKTFDVKEKGIIKLTEVDNSAQTTESDSNTKVCENTNDYIFALSYKDVMNPEYGFENTENQVLARMFFNTDYSLAKGATLDTYRGYQGYGDCWLRSPDYIINYHVSILYAGSVGYSQVDYAGCGVVPALQIYL